MVKINISIEGENLEDVVSDLLKIASKVVISNKKLLREMLKTVGEQAIDVLMEKEMLNRGADLYTEIMHSINWHYKQK